MRTRAIRRCADCNRLLLKFEVSMCERCRRYYIAGQEKMSDLIGLDGPAFSVGDRVSYTGQRLHVTTGIEMNGTWKGTIVGVHLSTGEVHVRWDDQDQGHHDVWKAGFHKLVKMSERGTP